MKSTIALLLAALALGQTVISNNAADMASHIVMVADSTTPRTVTNTFTFSGAQTFTGLATFNRGTSAPFAVTNASAAMVSNLDVDKLHGQIDTYYTNATNLASGTVAVARGGTGLSSGTSGGLLAYTASGTLASSAALAANALVLGGGAGVVPATNSNFTINSVNVLSSTTQFRAVAYHSTTQSINNNAFTAANLNSEDVDVGSLHDTVTNNSRLTVPTNGDGLYFVTAKLWFDPNATGRRIAQLVKNGATNLSRADLPVNSGANGTVVIVMWMGTLVATDYVEVQALQDSGGALNIGNASREIGNTVNIVKLW